MKHCAIFGIDETLSLSNVVLMCAQPTYCATAVSWLGEITTGKRPWKKHENKPQKYPQQRETKTAAKHAVSEVCLLPRPFYSRGWAYKVQSQHKHFMKKRFSKSVCNTVANMPEARAKGFLPKELLSASLFTSST